MKWKKSKSDTDLGEYAKDKRRNQGKKLLTIKRKL